MTRPALRCARRPVRRHGLPQHTQPPVPDRPQVRDAVRPRGITVDHRDAIRTELHGVVPAVQQGITDHVGVSPRPGTGHQHPQRAAHDSARLTSNATSGAHSNHTNNVTNVCASGAPPTDIRENTVLVKPSDRANRFHDNPRSNRSASNRAYNVGTSSRYALTGNRPPGPQHATGQCAAYEAAQHPAPHGTSRRPAHRRSCTALTGGQPNRAPAGPHPARPGSAADPPSTASAARPPGPAAPPGAEHPAATPRPPSAATTGLPDPPGSAAAPESAEDRGPAPGPSRLAPAPRIRTSLRRRPRPQRPERQLLRNQAHRLRGGAATILIERPNPVPARRRIAAERPTAARAVCPRRPGPPPVTEAVAYRVHRNRSLGVPHGCLISHERKAVSGLTPHERSWGASDR